MSAGRQTVPLGIVPDEHELPTTPTVSATSDIAISIISQSQLLRDGLVALLAAHLRVQIIGSYASQPAVGPLPNPSGHIVLLDGCLGRDMVIESTRFWRSQTPPAQVILLELANDITTILACIKAGASGYTLQGATAAEVASMIQDVQQGRAHCSPEVTAQLFALLAAQSDTVPLPSAPLTKREIEVLRYVAEDLTNQEIADRLVIDVRTVKHHVHNILSKLDLQHRWDAARLARERRWLE